MCNGYFIVTFLMLFIHVCLMDDKNCDYICDDHGCDTLRRKPYDDFPSIKYCKNEDIPMDMNFTLIRERNDIAEFPAKLQINFKRPQRMCMYQITLMANELISEDQCTNYIFNLSNFSEIHIRSNICFRSINNQYQDTVNISFPYIYTACYAINFYNGNRKIVRNAFFKTNYSHTEIIKPTITCSYKIVSDSIRELQNYEVSFSTPIVEDISLYLGFFYGIEGIGSCSINDEKLKDKYEIFHILEDHTKSKHHNFSTTLTVDGRYEANGTFQTKEVMQNVICFKIFYYDIRCKEYTLWNPPVRECMWIEECRNITNYDQRKFQINNDTDVYFSVILLIIIIALSVIIGTTYFIYTIYVCNVREDYTNVFEIDITNTNIVLLYPKGCETFMALMADFRKLLREVCGCAVHDWYNGDEWNYVAAVGGFEWFAEMLRKKYRIIWIDTPTMRSLITQQFKIDSFNKNSENHNYIEIGDFRDAVFPAIFNLAKCNVEQSTLRDSRHFIVRLRGFDDFKSETNPFTALTSRTCYFLPQDLKLLCSDLSISECDKVVLSTKQEEEQIGQFLCNIKSDFYK